MNDDDDLMRAERLIGMSLCGAVIVGLLVAVAVMLDPSVFVAVYRWFDRADSGLSGWVQAFGSIAAIAAAAAISLHLSSQERRREIDKRNAQALVLAWKMKPVISDQQKTFLAWAVEFRAAEKRPQAAFADYEIYFGSNPRSLLPQMFTETWREWDVFGRSTARKLVKAVTAAERFKSRVADHWISGAEDNYRSLFESVEFSAMQFVVEEALKSLNAASMALGLVVIEKDPDFDFDF